jgi:Na+-translocating ferredoxin:NAD+ oxidoreductase RnfD subunit
MSQPLSRIVSWVAAVLGVGELLDSLDISFWEGALVFGVLFLIGAVWTRRGGIGGPILVGILCAFEVQAFFQWARGGAFDWVTQVAVLVVSAAGLVGVLVLLKGTFAARRARRRIASAGV